MNPVLKFIFIVAFLLSCACHIQAQSRQSDSMKNKQLAYNKQLKDDAEKKKKEQLLKVQAKSGVEVVSYDSKGNKVESYVSKDGKKTTTTTIILPSILNRKFSADTINTDSIFIKVVKAKNRLQVYHKGRLLTAYKCVFGPFNMLPKQCEGDRRTPEGTFTIQTCKDHEKWDKFMLIDYPNDESRRLFEENKRTGVIPKCSTIGGLVGIHGIWQGGDNVIDMKHNWTDGCISLKNADVEELAKIIKPGVTKIMIVK